jgi:hypothetical protein
MTFIYYDFNMTLMMALSKTPDSRHNPALKRIIVGTPRT